MSESGSLQILSQGVGYGIIVGIGIFFALTMLLLTRLQNRYTTYSSHTVEGFAAASRSVKPGLIAAGIVSSWTWPGTLLTSATVTSTYGIAGAFQWACYGCFQITLFALLAVVIKRKVPGLHTYPELIRARHGTAAHLSYLFFALLTNLLVGSTLVLGGAQVVSALTGVNVYAVNFIIPLVVAAYVVSGGLRSTFIADYLHTAVLIISILIFSFLLYASGDAVGSPGKLYDLLVEAAITRPTANTNGSYLSFKSIEGLILSMDLLVGGIGTVWLDQAYWQRAIASQPETSVKAYLFGAVAWFGMPFSFGTAMGLGCAALTGLPSFPTYPNGLSAEQIGAGLSAPAVAVALLGKAGAALLLLLLFMAVTSSTSAELVAVSSLVTFDIYKTYIKPLATSEELVRSSHYAIIAYSIILASFCSLANGVHLNLTWLLTVGGIFTGGASFPVGLNLFWPTVSTVATVASCWISGALAIITWFVTTYKRSGEITVATTGIPQNAISGAVVGWLGGLVFAIVLTFVFPAQYSSSDPEHLARNQKIFGISSRDEGISSPPNGSNQQDITASVEKGKSKTATSASVAIIEPTVRTGNEVVDFLTNSHITPLNERSYKKALRLALGANAFVLPVILVTPLSLFGADYIASRSFFEGYVVVSFGWVWGTLAICVIWPVWESREQILGIVKGLIRSVGRRRE